MEKEQIISTLTEKLGTTQLSSRTIGTYVENNLLAEGTEPDDAYWTKHVNILKSLQGQFSADVANQVNTFKADWEKAHKVNVPEPKPANPPTPPTPPNDDANAKLLARLDALEKQLKDANDKNAQQALKDGVKGKSTELKVANKYLWDKVANEAQVTENMTSEQLLEKVKNTYETELKNIIGNGAAPYGVSGGAPNPQESLKSLDNYFAQKKSQGKF